MAVFEKTRTILAALLNIDESRVAMKSLLVEDLGAEPLDFDNILVELEQQFSLEFPEDVAQGFERVGDVVDYIIQQTDM